MLGEVERLSESFATDITGVGFLSGVDAVVPAQSFSSPEALATDLTAVRPVSVVARGQRAASPPHD